jgi:hypothetical protein
MRGIPILATIGIVAAALFVSGQPEPKPAEAAPVAHDYAAELAKLQAELDTLKSERDELRAAYDARDAEARKYQDAHDRLLLKQSSLTPQVRPSPVAYVAAPRKAAAASVPTGRWVDVPVYGPLGRQRGTRREWQSNQRVQYRGNCAGGVCR